MRDLFRRIFLNPFLELVKAVGPVLYKLSVIEFLIYDDVEQSKSEGPVRARSNLKPQIRFGCHPSIDGINHDGFRPTLHTVDDPGSHKPVITCIGGVLSPYHDALGQDKVRVIVSFLKELGAIRNGVIPLGHTHTHEPGMEARIPGQPSLEPVGTAVGIGG